MPPMPPAAPPGILLLLLPLLSSTLELLLSVRHFMICSPSGMFQRSLCVTIVCLMTDSGDVKNKVLVQ